MPRIVEPVGPTRAKMYFIGEALGEVEEQYGEPFRGPAGNVYNNILATVGIIRATVRINNAFRERPPNNQVRYFYKGEPCKSAIKPEFIHYIEELMADIRRCKPSVIIPMGNVPLSCLLGITDITTHRGYVFSWEGIPVLPSVHPSWIQRGNWQWATIAANDFRRAQEIAQTKNFKLPEPELIIRPTHKQVTEYLRGLISQANSGKSPIVSVDIETIGASVACIGFSHKHNFGFCVPFVVDKNPYFSESHTHELWLLIEKVLTHPGIRTVMHNALFDSLFLARNYNIYTANLWMDTMIAQHAVYPAFPKGLWFLTSLYTWHPFYKGEGKMLVGRADIDYDKLYRYNAKDAVVTREVVDALTKELDATKTRVPYDFMMSLLPVLAEMSARGIKCDLDTMKQMHQAEADLCKFMQQKLDDRIGGHINVKSPIQMKELIAIKLGYPLMYKRGAKNPSTDFEAMKQLLAKTGNPVIQQVIDVRKCRDMLSKFFGAPKHGNRPYKMVEDDGVFRCSYNPTGTVTGRLSSSKTIFGTGANLQNVPKSHKADLVLYKITNSELTKLYPSIAPFLIEEDGRLLFNMNIRSVFVARPGFSFIVPDLSQAEARVVAYLSRETTMIKAFDAGGDIHKRTASLIYHKPMDEITYAEREKAKRSNHAANYGVGERKLAAILNIPVKEARELLALQFATFPGVKTWHAETLHKIDVQHYLITPLGRKCIFYGVPDPGEAYAWVPQSTIGDLMNRGIRDFGAVRTKLNKDWHILHNGHDSMIVEVPDKEINQAGREIVKALTIPLKIGIQTLTIPISFEVGKAWTMGEEVDDDLFMMDDEN
ncbi:MAG: DNA polymerase [Candidatus Paceibacterota bacterium]